ncbi:orotate phosphoribosyltransferase [Trichodelitschia bisporula]|uniref:Orotate phosphoribosyltransferase n=1 Tax=Trichodelitschia bisporula TaxID=703511 RepID=A0A6G1HIP7_9PEZI|nr:orotate phosphoribosyltransferase [Trichodelitschia bisporula]
MSLTKYKMQFIKDSIDANALSFGTFTLKSGRISPYFFNAGLFHRAAHLRSISRAYAHAIASHTPALEFDVLFGPAYKGIPLAAATLDKLAEMDPARFGNVSYSFDRKEVKNHGEGGSIVGAPLKGKRVVIIDDVMTAGTAIRGAIDIIKREGGELVGIVVSFDRQEKTPAKEGEDEDAPRGSTIGAVRKEYGIPVLSILTLDDILEFFRGSGSEDELKRLDEYQKKYKATD